MSVDSTQLEALRQLEAAADSSDCDPFVLWTTQQTHGRGRYGRSWINCGESLAMSFAWPELAVCGSAADHAWPIRVSLAVVEAIAAIAQQVSSEHVVGVKWPNDIMLGDAKLGGVLVQRHLFSSGAWLIAGIGLNLRWQAERPADRQVADLADLGLDRIDPGQLVRAVQDAMTREIRNQSLVGQPSAAGAALERRFDSRDVYAGLPVSVHDAMTGNLVDQGINRGINQAGELLLETAQALREIRAGEVSLRPIEPAALKSRPWPC